MSTADEQRFLALVLGVAGAYIALTAGYLHDLEPLRRVPFVHLGITVIGLPVVAAAAGWLLVGREPPALARTALE